MYRKSSGIVDKYGIPFINGEQSDLSVVGSHGEILDSDARFQILDTVSSLPVTGYLNEIKSTIAENTITILQSPTGSGKSTQTVKAALELYPEKLIIATQPRVIGATSIADRVSKELMAETGNANYSLGYGVGFKTGQTVNTKHTSNVSFHTDGLELRRQLISQLYPDLLIIDEIHGFSIPIEYLLVNLVRQMEQRKINTKLVLMSATMNPSILQDLFKNVQKNIPVISFEGRTFPVSVYHNPGEAVEKTVGGYVKNQKDVLLFVPGKKEIEATISTLNSYFHKLSLRDESFIVPNIYKLHAELPVEEQKALLQKQDESKGVVIVSTNVAEESITVHYIKAVVDTGKEKSVYVNEHGIPVLVTQDISQANSKQRQGRAGRTSNGEYTRINTPLFDEMEPYPIAPIEKELLDSYILLGLTQGLDLSKSQTRECFLHKPPVDLIKISFDRLRTLGAINSKNQVTQLGVELLKYPLTVFNGAILQEAIKRNCLGSIITMVAILEKKGFVGKAGLWKNIKLTSKIQGDLFGYKELFDLITSHKLSPGKIELFYGLGLDGKELRRFLSPTNDKMLFEVVNLEPIGIKNKRVFEIYNLIQDLNEKCKSNNLDISQEGTQSDIVHSLTVGHLHFVFKYDKTKKVFVSHAKKMKNLEFMQGDVSLIEPKGNHLYIAQPFIIGGEGTKPDFNLLTQLTPIDESVLQEFTDRTHQIDWEMFGEQNPAFAEKRLTQQDILNLSIGDKSDISDEVHNMFNATKSREHLSKNWLPYFLVVNNVFIRDFIAMQDEGFDVPKFTELLKRITVQFAHLIEPNKPNATEKFFTNDRVILDRFLASGDKIIRKFLDTPLEKEGDISSLTSSIEFSQRVQETSTAISDYIKILRSIKLDQLLGNKEEDIHQFVNKVVKGFFYSEKGTQIFHILDTIDGFDITQKRDLLTSLQSHKTIFKNLDKTLTQLVKSKRTLHQLQGILLGVTDISTLEYLFEDKKFSGLKTACQRILDKDPRKNQRGKNSLEKIIQELKNEIDDLSSQENNYLQHLDFAHIPILAGLKESWIDFLSSSYDSTYYSSVLKPRIFTDLAGLLQMTIDGRVNLEKFITDKINTTHLSHLLVKGNKSKYYDDLEDINDEYLVFSEEIYQEILSKKDLEYIVTSLEKLRNFKAKFDTFLTTKKEA